MDRLPDRRASDGFSLIELLVVVAIMITLVGIIAPAMFSHFNRANRALDASNAKQISTALMNACILGEVEFPADPEEGDGVWVMMCRDGVDTAPDGYRGKTFQSGRESVWCGVSAGITVKGVESTHDMVYNYQLEDVLKEYGIDVVGLRTHSKSDKDGWDWIIIEIGYDNDKQLVSRIYSGYKNENGSILRTDKSNIEKWIY